ncbi:MAG: Gfo/Idh/MocA family oxidoreductase [Candidatus Hydrogenedentes bacterium]|nr:Gfo/Idh/MocA family oxidoreductase [Candidatus Hydrogenedentota bacterium]
MNLAIIGCGGMGGNHAQFATNCGLNLVACGDSHKKKAQALAKRFGAEATDDCMALCRRDDVDIVGIMTPTPTHSAYVIAAAEAGKHIFCEKPFGRTVDECLAAEAAVKKAGVRLFVGHVVRYFHEFEAIRAQIEAGKAGNVGFVKAYRGGIFPQGEDMWFRDYEQSGGVTFDSSIHDYDWIRYVFGDVERVFCQALQRDDAIDYALVTLRMKSGVIAHVIGTWAHPAGFRVKVEVCGDNGMITYDNAEAPISSMMRQVEGGQPTMIVPANPVETSPYQLEWVDFLAALEGKGEPKVTPEDATWAVRIASAALESAKSGEPVTL